MLFYVGGEIILIGLFLSLYQLEIFAAFLWMTEVIVILVGLFLLFSINPTGSPSSTRTPGTYVQTIGVVILLIITTLGYTHFGLQEGMIQIFMLGAVLWDNFYEALYNENMNDLYGLYLNYYWCNSFVFVLFGIVLLIGSVVCVQLNRLLKVNKAAGYVSWLHLFNAIKDGLSSFFLRKQTLVDQGRTVASTRPFSKKKSDYTEVVKEAAQELKFNL